MGQSGTMAALEGLQRIQTRLQQPKQRRERARLIDLHLNKPNVEAPGDIRTVDFEDLKRKGVNTLLLDAEGTFVEQGGWKVDKEVIKKIKDAKFENVAVITNYNIHDEMSFVQANFWALQIGADILLKPDGSKERKPHPDMIEKAISAYGVRPDQAAMLGDNMSTDVKAANRAGVHSVLVERYGNADLWGDRYLRRPLEEFLRWELERQETVAPMPSAERSREFVVYDREEKQEKLPSWAGAISKELMDKSRIVNVGGPTIVPEQAEMTDGPTGLFSRVKSKYNEFGLNHGRTAADALTKARLYGGLAEGALILIGREDIARILDVPVRATDLLDGDLARRHIDGPTVQGAKDDQMTDKKHSLAVEIPLFITGKLEWYDLVLRFGPDLFMTKLREYYASQGVDVKAGWAGKLSTTAVSIAENVAMGEANPRYVQNIANGAKVARVFIYWMEWERKLQKMKRDQEIFETAKAELLAA